MGRTNPTYRDFLERYEDAFGDVRRALRRRYQDDFDRLFARARSVADAAGYANHVDRDRLVALSMLLGHETALRERTERIDDLEETVADLEAAVADLDEELSVLRERLNDERSDEEDA